MHCTIDEYKEKFPNSAIRSESYLKEQSERIKGDKNPAYQHGGKYSPFSEKFIHGKDAKIHERISKKRKESHNTNTTTEFYIKRGFSHEDAQKELSKRQSTFSLEKCVKKFGQEKGTEIWKARQEKWLATLDAKSPEEKTLINQKKMNPDICISKAERELSDILAKHFDLKTQQSIVGSSWIYDMMCKNKIIEYHGDYWHCNPSKYDANYFHARLNMSAKDKWNIDLIKQKFAMDNGYDYLIIWESEYKQNPKKVIDECLCFLNK
jgi:very-short-patch-repair endonuclease